MTSRTPLTSRSVLCVVLVALCLTAWGQGETDIARVSLTVRDGGAAKPTAGSLYRAEQNRREYVADVAEDGKLDKAIKCKPFEKFEAQAESKLDRPVAPIQLTCKNTLAFSFTRMFVGMIPVDAENPLGSKLVGTGVETKVFGSYADIFKKAGNSAAVKTWGDAAKISAAKNLGDSKLDKFVYRDPARGYDLAFTPEGVNALKVKQVELGVAPTGDLDHETQDAFAKVKTIPSSTKSMKCMSKGSNYFTCEPYSGLTEMVTKDVVVLPKIELGSK